MDWKVACSILAPSNGIEQSDDLEVRSVIFICKSAFIDALFLTPYIYAGRCCNTYRLWTLLKKKLMIRLSKTHSSFLKLSDVFLTLTGFFDFPFKMKVFPISNCT